MIRRRVVTSLALALPVVLALLAGPGAAQQPAPSPDLAGTWQLAGWQMGADPTGEPSYRGTIRLERREKDTYVITWVNAAGADVNRGVGLYDPRTGAFAAGYSIGQSPGVAVYQIAQDRKAMDCVGTFLAGVGDVARESWRRE